MRSETQRRVNAMLADLRNAPKRGYEVREEHFDMAEALYVFAHDCGEYDLFSAVSDLPFKGHPRLATGDDRGLTDEGLVLYRELLEMEGLS